MSRYQTSYKAFIIGTKTNRHMEQNKETKKDHTNYDN